MSRASYKPKKALQKAKPVQTTTEEKTVRPFRPTGGAPKATVVSRHEASTVTRSGRGFSARELLTVGLGLKSARGHGVQVDLRRGSLLEANVASLNTWFRPTSEPSRQEKVPRAVKAKKVEKAKKIEVKPVRKTRKRVGKKNR